MPEAPVFTSLISEVHSKLKAEASNQNSRRLFHGRGKWFSGLDWLNLDYHSSLLVFTLYRPSGKDTLDESWVDALKEVISSELNELIKECDIQSVLIQRRDIPGAPIETLIGDIDNESFALRKGMEFSLNFKQQNVGYFLDIEPARVWLETIAENKKVLNLFSYTCAFSVVAASAGAKSVVNIDMSARSLDRGRANHKINDISTDNVKFFAHDIFKSWGKLKKFGPYDVVILDPPSFQKGSFIADKDYVKSVRRSAELLNEGGFLLACLNAPELSVQQLKDWVVEGAAQLQFETQLQANSDFPESEPGRELKMLVYKKGS